MRGPRPYSLIALTLALLGGCSGGSGGGSPTPTPAPPEPATTGAIIGSAVSASDEAVNLGVGASVSGLPAVQSSALQAFTLSNVPVGERVLVRLSAPGHMEQVKVVPVRGAALAALRATLVPVGASTTFDVSLSLSAGIAGSPARLDAPANAFVRADNAAPASGNLTLALASLDPGRNPARLPGDHSTLAGGVVAALESFGALGMALQDASGQRHQLAAGQTMTMRIPLSSREAGVAPASIALYYFDDTNARWVEQGRALLGGTGAARFYEGTVARVAVWAAARRADTVLVRGCVELNGQRVAHAALHTQGMDHNGAAQGVTGADGNFSVALRKNRNVALTALSALAAPGDPGAVHSSAPLLLGPLAADTTLAQCLQLRDAGSFSPSFVLQPQDATAAEDALLAFTALADGALPLRLQWQRNGVDLPGATGSTLVLTAAAADQGATYSVLATNAHGSLVSRNATLAIGTPTTAPQIAREPAPIVVSVGQSAIFGVTASGAEPLSYQWRRNGVAIAGATAPSYLGPPAALPDSGALYSVVIANALGQSVSADAALSVISGPTPADTYKRPLARLAAGSHAAGCVDAGGAAAAPIVVGADGNVAWSGGQIVLASRSAEVSVSSNAGLQLVLISDPALNRELAIASPGTLADSEVTIRQIDTGVESVRCLPGLGNLLPPLAIGANASAWFEGLSANLTCSVLRAGVETTQALALGISGGSVSLGSLQLPMSGPHQFEAASNTYGGEPGHDMRIAYAFGAADGSTLSMWRWAAGRSMQVEHITAGLDFYSCAGERTD
jgi:hypothetical protein